MDGPARPGLDRPGNGPLAALTPPVSAGEVPEDADADVAVRVRGVGKKYHLYDRPQDRLKEQLLSRFGRSYGREFWALHDVSFDVRRGERVGIIGRNGAGKSTLLQLIAGTLTPSTGEVSVRGRVAALLELGSGFNPEFTGRENVFMNGAILGVARAEMLERFDAIAAFADIGDFIDQPVKIYSSGMFVRLAFAVHACIEPDVLIVDEALAVGDVFFRQKCYARLEALRQRGTAILLVSHAMPDVEEFCERALLLHHGRALFQGDASEAVKRYYLIEQEERAGGLAVGVESPAPPTPPASHHEGFAWPPPHAFIDISSVAQVANGWARCTGVALCDREGLPRRVFQQGETGHFCYEFELLRDIEVPIGGVVIQSDQGVIVHGKNTLQYETDVPVRASKGSRVRFHQEIVLDIKPDEYSFEIGFATVGLAHYNRRAESSHQHLSGEIIRVCHLPRAGHFLVGLRRPGKPVQLLHHGLVNLPGRCEVHVLA